MNKLSLQTCYKKSPNYTDAQILQAAQNMDIIVLSDFVDTTMLTRLQDVPDRKAKLLVYKDVRVTKTTDSDFNNVSLDWGIVDGFGTFIGDIKYTNFVLCDVTNKSYQDYVAYYIAQRAAIGYDGAFLDDCFVEVAEHRYSQAIPQYIQNGWEQGIIDIVRKVKGLLCDKWVVPNCSNIKSNLQLARYSDALFNEENYAYSIGTAWRT